MASSTSSSVTTVSGDSSSAGGNSGKDQTDEIALIKSAYSGRCRIIEDSGDYKHIVTIQPEDLDVTIKFQLRATYPSVIPDIAVRSASLKGVQISELRNSLTAKSKELIGTPMIRVLLQQAQDMLPTFGLKPGKVGTVYSHTVITDKSNEKKKKKKKHKPKSEDEVEEEKKKPMKTADDVIKRILWDESLDKDDFLVGYIDRFRGLLEKYFSAFSWEDLASVDYDVLAVPRHRIQYFKYKSVKVWDKPHRLDNVFGSARGTKTIDIVIKEVEEMEERQKREGDYPNHAVQQRQDEEESLTDDSDDDSDDEDDIMVTIGASVNIGIKTKSSLETQSEKESQGNIDANGEDSYDPYWRDKLRPNYFVCVRITDPAILDKVGEVQDHLLDQEPLFGECCIPGVSLHITLCTLGLDTPEQLVHCMNALNKMKDELISVLPKSVLRLHGVSHFYNRVVYAKVVYRDDFLDFCNALKLNLREAGVDIRDGYEFVPHMTIIKTTRPVSRLRGNKNIDPVMYEPFLGMHFGEQKISSINLCSMSTERRDDGFYMTPLELQLQ